MNTCLGNCGTIIPDGDKYCRYVPGEELYDKHGPHYRHRCMNRARRARESKAVPAIPASLDLGAALDNSDMAHSIRHLIDIVFEQSEQINELVVQIEALRSTAPRQNVVTLPAVTTLSGSGNLAGALDLVAPDFGDLDELVGNIETKQANNTLSAAAMLDQWYNATQGVRVEKRSTENGSRNWH